VTDRPGIFVGSWYGHGRSLVVKAGGSATVTYRTYTFCSDNPAPPCDQMKGHLIYPGGRVAMRITRVVTAHQMSTATARVVSSTDQTFPPGSKQTFVLKGDVITWTHFGNFCGDRAAPGTCGA
jgi:hypothetical protein